MQSLVGQNRNAQPRVVPEDPRRSDYLRLHAGPHGHPFHCATKHASAVAYVLPEGLHLLRLVLEVGVDVHRGAGGVPTAITC